MNENRTWLSPGTIFAAMFLITAAMTVAIVFRNAAALAVLMGLTLAVAAAVAVVAARTRRDPDAFAPPGVHSVEAEQRRRILAAVNSGARASDPALAPAVVAVARRQRRGHAVFLASGSVPVGFRLSHLLSGATGSVAVLDQIVIVVWLVLAGFLVRGLVRTTRAIAANS